MAMRRRATATWTGNLIEGSGTTSFASGVVTELPVDWRARTEDAESKTSPEELIASAHATCFAMALSNALSQDGHEPAQLDTSATVTFDKTDAGWRIKNVELKVVGQVDIDEDSFAKAAEAAKEGCPVSNALKGNVDISVEAELSSSS